MSEVSIQIDDFDVGAEYEALRNFAKGSGAVVLFVGLVRDLYQEQSEEKVDYIELQHYSGMTESLCEQIIGQARERFPLEAVRVIHRVGKLYADQQIVLVAVASRHRDSAFQAAQFIMDYLKTRATLWKKEVGTKGEHWVGMKQSDSHAATKW